MTKEGYWKHVKNIQKEYLEKDRAVPYIIANITVHMNPDGDGERESSDTEDRSEGSSSEDMDCSKHSHCNVNDKCFLQVIAAASYYLHQSSNHPMLPAFFKYLSSLNSPELDRTFCMACIVI